MNIYDKVKKVILLFEEEGEFDIANELANSMNYSSTGTEAFMKIRYFLKSSKINNLNLKRENSVLIDEIIFEINNKIK